MQICQFIAGEIGNSIEEMGSLNYWLSYLLNFLEDTFVMGSLYGVTLVLVL